jgi:hypothetical protein
MGLAASQARILMLTARKSNLELSLQFINQARMQLANMTSGLFNQQANLEPDSPYTQRLNAQIASIQSRDKQFEMESKRIDTQHQSVQTEIDAVAKVISKNIESSFKLMG